MNYGETLLGAINGEALNMEKWADLQEQVEPKEEEIDNEGPVLIEDW